MGSRGQEDLLETDVLLIPMRSAVQSTCSTHYAVSAVKIQHRMSNVHDKRMHFQALYHPYPRLRELAPGIGVLFNPIAMEIESESVSAKKAYIVLTI